MKKFLKIIAGLLLAILILLLASFRPVDRKPYQRTDYFKQTITNLEKLKPELAAGQPQPFFAGFGKAGITPPVGVPLAGYGARKGAPSEGVHDSLFVRVMALKAGNSVACIIGFDALIFNPPLARQFEKKALQQLNMQPEQFYYTATHTHSGPGGWGQGVVEEMFSGKPDERVPQILIDSTLVAVRRAIRAFSPAEFGTGAFDAPTYIRNRLIGDEGQVDPQMVYLAIREDGKLKAVFATYSAHATVLSSGNMLFSGDYPGYFERKVESAINGLAIFAAAGLGSHSYRGEGSGFEKAQYVGYGLADSLLKYLGKTSFQSKAVLRAARLPIAMHDLQIRVSDNIRLAPWLAKRFFHTKDSYLSILTLDHFVMLGSPGEFSGELALKVKEHARAKNLLITITSFNGCYVGYVTPSQYYKLNEYETRLMSFFGPYAGDYFVDIMNRVIDMIPS